MAWMWWMLGLVAVGLVARAVVVDLRRPAPAVAPVLRPGDRVRLAQLDQAIAGAVAHVSTLELAGAPVATAGPLTLGTHRVTVDGRGLDVGPGLRVFVELDHPVRERGARHPSRRRAVRGLHGALITLPPGATAASTASSVALLSSIDGTAGTAAPTDDHPVTITFADAGGDELQAQVPVGQHAEAAALLAQLDALLDTERALLDARRGVAVAEARRTLTALRAARAALAGSEGPASATASVGDQPLPAAWSVVAAADAQRKAELLQRLRDHAALDLRNNVLELTATAADEAPGKDDLDIVDLRALGATS